VLQNWKQVLNIEKKKEYLKLIPGSPISETSGQCKRGDDKDVKYIVPKLDSTYSLSDEEGKAEVIKCNS